MEKLRVAIVFGGCSDEYPISLQSAYAVITHLNSNKYEPFLLGITRDGTWYLYRGDPQSILDDTWHQSDACTPAVISPSRDIQGIIEWDSNTIQAHTIDVALPILHGKNGEDGTVQGLIELAGIPIAGCGATPAALCMDKDKAHKLVSLAGIRTPRSHLVNRASIYRSFSYAAELGYPLFIKPVKAGSSFGISKVSDKQHLIKAIKSALEHDTTVIMEEAIAGFETGCAILGNDDLIVGALDEIELSQGFFDFDEKYSLKTSAIHVPARISEDTERSLKETAVKIYKVLGCTGFARVDLFLTPDGEIVFNEVNTIPGFTNHSRFPSMLKAIGMSFEEIIDTVLDRALEGSFSQKHVSEVFWQKPPQDLPYQKSRENAVPVSAVIGE